MTRFPAIIRLMLIRTMKKFAELVGTVVRCDALDSSGRAFVPAEQLMPDLVALVQLNRPDLLQQHGNGMSVAGWGLLSMIRTINEDVIYEDAKAPRLVLPRIKDAAEPPSDAPTRDATERAKPMVIHVMANKSLMADAIQELMDTAPKERSKWEANRGIRYDLLNKLWGRPARQLPRAVGRHFKILDGLREDFQNFAEVCDWLELQLILQVELKGPLGFSPCLIYGEPGVGKTAFVRALAARFAAEYLPVSVAATSAGWAIRGSHRMWRDAGPGQIASRVTRLPPGRNLVCLLDEIDKISDRLTYPVDPILLELFEPSQSCAFTDEFLDVPLNITPMVSFFCTANDISKVSAPVQSRLRCFQIRKPTRAQMPMVVRSLDREYRQSVPGLERRFKAMDDEVVAAFASLSPREVYRALETTYSISLRRPRTRGKRSLTVADVSEALACLARAVPVGSGTSGERHASILDVFDANGGGAPPTFH